MAKLNITIQPEESEDDLGLVFSINLPKKHINVAKEAAKLITAVKKSIESIKNELGEDT